MDSALTLWLVLTAGALLLAAYDVARHTPISAVMKWGWLLVILYTGPVGLVVYLLSCREPLRGTHGAFVTPLWKQAVGSTIHCVAGDATGIVLGALVARALHVPMSVDVGLEYVAGFAFGLFIFQALFMRLMAGGGYWRAVRRTILPEWLSMNALMGGMIPSMVILMTRDPGAMDPGLRFWGVMSLSIMVGALLAYPVNLWLVARGLKHGMGTARVLGRGGDTVQVTRMAEHGARPPRWEFLAVTLATLAALFAGLLVGF